VYLIGVWLGEDQRTNTMKTHVSKPLGCAFKFLPIAPDSIANIVVINNHGLPIIITTLGEVLFSAWISLINIVDFLMQHKFHLHYVILIEEVEKVKNKS
jgi:hypothetical protein